MRLNKLEARVAALVASIPRTPTLDEFKAKWLQMDELSKSIYVGLAECPELFGVNLSEDETMAAICRYLDEMGLVGERIDLQALVDELEEVACCE